MNRVQRLMVASAAVSLAVIGAGTGSAEAQTAPTGGIAATPNPAAPGESIAVTGTFTSQDGSPWRVVITQQGSLQGAFDPSSLSTSSGLQSCSADANGAECLWTPTGAGETVTMSANLVVNDDATSPSVWFVTASYGDPAATSLFDVGRVDLDVAPPPTTTTTTTAPATTDPAPTPTTAPPSGGGNTGGESAGGAELPATGTSTWMLAAIATAMLGAGFTARRWANSD